MAKTRLPVTTKTSVAAPTLALDLGGPDWTLRRSDQKKTLPARVPGCVHADLLRAKALPPLFWRDNEIVHKELIRHDWVWEKTFVCTPDLLARPRIWLRAEGLDTLAEIRVNGTVVLTADNMFRTWEADLKPVLKPGKNSISVTIRSPLPVMAERNRQRNLPQWNCYDPAFAGRGHVRKQACSFGWDWGPAAPSSGIWQPLTIHAADHGRLVQVRVTQHHTPGCVRLMVTPEVEGWGGTLGVHAVLNRAGAQVAAATGAAGASLELVVDQPELWWPNGLGVQPLYELRVELLGPAGTVDVWQRRIGLRTLELVREADQFGESFAFRCNGLRFFAKGANWIPCDVWPSEVNPTTVRRLLADAAACHMNMIREWGGGIYESDTFYDTCDELGLLVWQDCMFACGTYPGGDPAFLANVAAEIRDQARRLRDHACMALWCGNNELEQGIVGDGWTSWRMDWPEYKAIFDELLPRVLAAESPAIPYWPCSPHTPKGDRTQFNDPASGDAHCWDVWFGSQPFEKQREWSHRFQSEFGFQSLPEPRTVAEFTLPEDRNLTSRIMDFHQRSVGTGNKQIMRYLLDWFRLPTQFDELLWATQVLQGLCIQFAAEHTRRNQQRMEGCLYWQLNDRWPAATWSSIDWRGRWKALQYMARRFFAPVLVSGLENLEKSTVAVHLSNQRATPFRGEVRWRITDARGKQLATGRTAVTVPAQTNHEVRVLDCTALRRRAGAHLANGLNLDILGTGALGQFRADSDTLVWLEAWEGRTLVSRSLVLWSRPKHLDLVAPKITTQVKAVAGAYQITLKSQHPALWTRMELHGIDARFSDNFLHLDSHTPQTVTVTPSRPLNIAQVRKHLRVTSLMDW
jgi:beta-mannosidase